MGLSYLFIFLTLIGCSTATYKIQSFPPDAEVTFLSVSGEKKTLGKTPVNVNADEINASRSAFSIEIEKTGFEKQKIHILDSTFSKSVEATVNLQSVGTNGGGKVNSESLNQLASTIADVQKDIQLKSYASALEKLNRLQAEFPGVATLHSLIGNIHYLERRLDRALGSYKQALQLNPNQIDVQRMIQKIESIQGAVQ